MRISSEMTTDYFHDAFIEEIVLKIDSQGNRTLRLRLQCDEDCGVEDWNGAIVDVFFYEPLLILGELFGHMANAESLDSWTDAVSERMRGHLYDLTSAGIWAPKHMVLLVFHSGSALEVACRDIQFHRA